MYVFLFLFLLSLNSCATTNDSTKAVIVGHWQMDKIVMDGENDVSSEHNPKQNRFVIFNADGTFESGGDPYGRNTGKWSLSAESNELHLDSDAGEDDDSYWIATIEPENMHWQGARFDFNKRFQVYHVRQK